MKKLIALVVSIMFSFAVAGFAVAQAPAPKPGEKKMEKKETKADCLKMAKDDAAKKAECEKKFPKKEGAAAATPKK
jgi:hypothetical protein